MLTFLVYYVVLSHYINILTLSHPVFTSCELSDSLGLSRKFVKLWLTFRIQREAVNHVKNCALRTYLKKVG